MTKKSPYQVNGGRKEVIAGVAAGLLVAAIAVVSVEVISAKTTPPPHSTAGNQSVLAAHRTAARFADVGDFKISKDARFIADWVADSGDAGGKPFVIIDKKNARVYVFDRDAHLAGTSPVLLGLAPGDDTVPGIGDRPLSQVLPSERTTPAGRFNGERGHNARGEDVVWVDYDAAVSMHRVLTTNRAEHRLERLETPSIEDNRVSFGCINVPVAFYEKFIRPTFAHDKAVIYVLPEAKTVQQVFRHAYDVAAVHGTRRNEVARVPDANAFMVLLYALRS